MTLRKQVFKNWWATEVWATNVVHMEGAAPSVGNPGTREAGCPQPCAVGSGVIHTGRAEHVVLVGCCPLQKLPDALAESVPPQGLSAGEFRVPIEQGGDARTKLLCCPFSPKKPKGV